MNDRDRFSGKLANLTVAQQSTPSPELAESLALVRQRWPGGSTDDAPRTALILGTGLGDLADEIAAEAIIPYREIPHFPHSTALAHKGNLILGTLCGQPVVAMQGRCHLYEGYSIAQATLGVRLMHALGAGALIVSNAAGGLNPSYASGDVMLLEDHISFLYQQVPGAAVALHERVGRSQPRVYDAGLIEQSLEIARRGGFACQRGVYLAVTGPTYETRAEIRLFRQLGADCVGMSTVPEALTAAALGMRVLGISTVTNVASPDAPHAVSAEEVVDVAHHVRGKVLAIVRGLLALG